MIAAVSGDHELTPPGTDNQYGRGQAPMSYTRLAAELGCFSIVARMQLVKRVGCNCAVVVRVLAK